MKVIKVAIGLVLGLFCCYGLLVWVGDGLGKKSAMGQLPMSEFAYLFFGHRGMLYKYPENSFIGIEAARKLRLRGVEVDIRQSKDGHFVLFHDANAKALIGVDRPLSDFNLNELEQYPILQWSFEKNHKVLSLQEALDTFKNDLFFYLDMKVSTRQVAQSMVKLLQKNEAIASCLVASSDIFFIAYLEYFYPEVHTVLEGFDASKIKWYEYLPRRFRPDFLSSSIEKIDPVEVQWLKQKGLLNQRIVYDVDHTNFRKALRYGLHKMIVDYDKHFWVMLPYQYYLEEEKNATNKVPLE